MSPVLQVRLLGEFSLMYQGCSVTTITGRSQALLTYLLLHRQTPQLRQRLAFHLWSESTETQARTNLRKELSYLRHALPNADQFLFFSLHSVLQRFCADAINRVSIHPISLPTLWQPEQLHKTTRWWLEWRSPR